NIYEPKVIRNIISKQTSNILKGILSQCVSRGTAGNAYVKGYNIAGMTGTGLRTEGKKQIYIPSFTGFASLNNHSIACIVVFENSGKSPYGHGGGLAAAPVGGQLLKETLDYLNRK
ncbi:MAG TPA: penicillin-binding transpeptidase domain-containing protein, partial [Clostridia bacterium]|nr:penicillin-binding transpeptidase domain-containing protein [Clostridia bacterium]